MRVDGTDVGHRNFAIETCLGRGGFGEVYLARMETTGGLSRRVALKVLREGLDPGSQAIERLRDEGRLLAGLEHPVILKVHDVVVLGGRVALVTEYVAGQDLSVCMRAPGALRSRALVQIVGDVASALAAAWRELELVHRDIKPANIRIGTHGQVRLLDFGIARSDTMAREARTATNLMVGSLPYMAPERFLTSEPHPGSDVFALGACLYEGLTGHRLQRDPAPMTLAGRAIAPRRYEEWLRRRLARVPVELPPELHKLLGECLLHDPAARPTAARLAERCEALDDALPGPTLKRWARRRSWAPVVEESGPLVGRVVSEGTLEHPSATSPTEPGARGPAASGGASVPGPSVWRRLGVAVVGAGSLALLGALVVGLLGAGLWFASGLGGAQPVATAGNLPPGPGATPATGDELTPTAGGQGKDRGHATRVATDPAGVDGPDGPVPQDAPARDIGTTAPAAPDAAPLPAAPPAADLGSDALTAVHDPPEPTRAPAARRPAAPPDPVPPAATVVAPRRAAPAPSRGPAPAAPPEPATFTATGGAQVILRGDVDHAPGPVPPGTYDIVADFGAGPVSLGPADCPPGGTCAVRCNALLGQCRATSEAP